MFVLSPPSRKNCASPPRVLATVEFTTRFLSPQLRGTKARSDAMAMLLKDHPSILGAAPYEKAEKSYLGLGWVGGRWGLQDWCFWVGIK